jgi:transketolase
VNPDVSRGAYIISEADGGSPEVILIGTGSELSLAMRAQEKLSANYRIKARVVSFPSFYLFEKQDAAYRESVLPKAIKKRVTVEAASSFGWHKYATDEGISISVNTYGASAPGDQILKNYGFTVEHVVSAALRLMGRNDEAEKEYGATTTSKPAGPTGGHS